MPCLAPALMYLVHKHVIDDITIASNWSPPWHVVLAQQSVTCCGLCLQVEKELSGIQGRLNNPKFVANAKPEYIQEVQKQAADAADRLAVLEEKLQQLKSLQA